jgi:probable rRNA maturation factor
MPDLSVVVTDANGRRVGAGGLAAWVAAHAPARARGELTIALVSDAAMRRLNRMYRRKDYATDVLSFSPAFAKASAARHPARRSRRAAPPLGDIVIATGVAGRQARAQGHPLTTELRILALHGLLHLLGYDHEKDQGEMRRAEDRLRRKAGLPVGLIARAPRRSVL